MRPIICNPWDSGGHIRSMNAGRYVADRAIHLTCWQGAVQPDAAGADS
jgi:hypothetical protein